MSELALVCSLTGERYSPDLPIWRSPAGGLLDLAGLPRPDPGAWRSRAPGVWRYREVLPIREDRSIVTLGESATPLVPFEYAGRCVALKLDSLLPTGSYKDRGATVLISKVRELGIRRVVEDSSGNAGASIAGYCARAAIECDIFCPQSASGAKLRQITAFGARLQQVGGSREQVAAAAIRAAESTYYASHCWNPFFFHGTKTLAYEVAEQRQGRLPDAIVLPVGNGALLLGAYIGFRELAEAGLIDHLPRLVGVQAANCAPLSAITRPVRPTLAEGIAVATPIRAAQILEAIRATQGAIVSVAEHEIVSALRAALTQGLLIEPTSAAAIAALGAEATAFADVIVVITGNGLKTLDQAEKALTGRPSDGAPAATSAEARES